ncbi:MAG: preprotein translocase subunit SecE [Neisseriaceae bacterium]|nr:preprotein translocase subunit SecE [Neisseriaceae bacterium]
MSNKSANDLVAKSKSQSKEALKLKAAEEAKKSQRADKAKLLLATVLVVLGVVGFYALPALPIFVRALMPIVGVVLAVVIVFFWCSVGRRLTQYVRDSVTEVKKVVWPERNEAIKLTMFVIAFVMVLAMFIWVADWAISWLFYDVILGRR